MPEKKPANGRRNYPPAPKPPLRISGRYYSTDDAALILDVSKQRVIVFLNEGRLTGFMMSGIWFIAACSVERLMEMRDRGELKAALSEQQPEEVTG